MKPGLSLKEECEARMRRSTTRDGSKKRHLRSRHHSSSSSSSSSRSSRRHRSRSRSSSSRGSRGHHKSERSGRRHSRSNSAQSTDRTDRFGRRLNPFNVTNSKDPKAVASRVFLGSLPQDVIREDIETRFSKHGKILGITLLKGYGFVQYEEVEEALRAVEEENLSKLKGNKIDVRLASEHKKKQSSNQGDDNYRRPSREMDYPRTYPSPPRDPYADPYSRGLPPPPHLDPYHRPPHPADPYSRGHPLPPHVDPYHRGPLPPPYHRGPSHPEDPYARGPPYDPFVRVPPPPGDPYRHPPYAEPYPYRGPSPYGPSLPPPPPSVDCEIIVLDEKQRAYADAIKKRLMSAGIVTEMNILPRGVDVFGALEEATRRRLLFAIVVNDQNEIHRSITVNILHGLTQGTSPFVYPLLHQRICLITWAVKPLVYAEIQIHQRVTLTVKPFVYTQIHQRVTLTVKPFVYTQLLQHSCLVMPTVKAFVYPRLHQRVTLTVKLFVYSRLHQCICLFMLAVKSFVYTCLHQKCLATVTGYYRNSNSGVITCKLPELKKMILFIAVWLIYLIVTTVCAMLSSLCKSDSVSGVYGEIR